MSYTNHMMMSLHFSLSLLLLDFILSRGSGQKRVVLGLVTPLDHPPETTQWVTAWVGGLYILYIYRGDGVPG